MNLDLPTLLAADSFVTAMVGAILLVARWYNPTIRSAIWWGIACLLVSVATAVLAVKNGLPDLGSRVVVATLLNLASSCYWGAARRTRHASTAPAIIMAGALLWLAGLVLTPFRDSPSAQMSGLWAIGATYSYCAAFEMWRGRGERLKARWPLFALLLLDGSINAAGVVYGFFGEISADTLPPLSNPFGLIYFEAFLLTVGGAFLIVTMAFDREALGLRTVAHTDGLTGILNRGAFMEAAEASLDRSIRAGRPWSLITFDLDHFKAVNDGHGHAVGDEVLRCFAQVVRRTVRERDLIGRIGGEEFAAICPDTGAGTAQVIAERIRLAFSAACQFVGGRAVNATVSAGIASAGPGQSLGDVMKASDDALYRAKAQGRNRVERADADDGPEVVAVVA
jgi:diguanylate cyclase (GGDEF)-like protein